MRYQVSRMTNSSIIVEGRNAPDALDEACDYSNEHNWSIETNAYNVIEIPE